MSTATSQAIDLQPFCLPESDFSAETRPWLCKPINAGAYTYATNGHIMVRLGKCGGVSKAQTMAPDGKLKAFNIEKVMEGWDSAVYHRALWTLPVRVQGVCPHCKGSGDITLFCAECESLGTTDSDRGKVAEVGGAIFDLKYLRLIHSLPMPSIALATARKYEASHERDLPKPTLFMFECGYGAIMAMRLSVDALGISELVNIGAAG